MDSLQADLDHPAVNAFLDAVDEVMNSNTFLLKVRADTPIHVGNRDGILSAFLRERLFHEMIVDADRARGWWNLQDLSAESAATPPPAAATPGSLVWNGFRLTLSPLDRPGMATRLQWMLTAAFSPYNKHIAENRAWDLVTQFLQYVLGPEDGPCPGAPGQPPEAGRPWEFCTVRPDFLRTEEEEYECVEEEPSHSYYFGGRGSDGDTATFFYQHTVFYLLLTNGAP